MRGKRAKTIKKVSRPGAPPEENRVARRQLRSFTLKFLLAAALTVIPVSLIPEARYEPLNRFTARLVGDFLHLLTMDPVVREAHIRIDGFSVNVIAECTAVHLVALYAAFIFAFPANRSEKWIGFGAGTVLLFALNITRIALVTLIGRHFPPLFEAAHIYFGQLGMLLAMIVICLIWCRWITGPQRIEGPAGFIARFVLFSSPAFLLWVPLNRIYMGAIDDVIHWLFGLASYQLTIPRAHTLYYQTFSLIALAGLLFAVKGARLGLRLRWMAYGLAVLTLLQVTFRLCNVWIKAFQIGWMAPISQMIYVICVYVLPLAVALRFLMQVPPQRLVEHHRTENSRLETGKT